MFYHLGWIKIKEGDFLKKHLKFFFKNKAQKKNVYGKGVPNLKKTNMYKLYQNFMVPKPKGAPE